MYSNSQNTFHLGCSFSRHYELLLFYRWEGGVLSGWASCKRSENLRSRLNGTHSRSHSHFVARVVGHFYLPCTRRYSHGCMCTPPSAPLLLVANSVKWFLNFYSVFFRGKPGIRHYARLMVLLQIPPPGVAIAHLRVFPTLVNSKDGYFS